ncbi:flagellar biosynthesis anti-sigma factor FlgM [Acidocella sp.]|uniref:flagellar biosynthesis anti-sigma factor FlgM n=1 Tax=Acidocella sp. TaxID=50710 RepID=UPI00260339D6|nr:flagellar biosynthesis anti-sigma factor FlgM [Acidocella sp.]
MSNTIPPFRQPSLPDAQPSQTANPMAGQATPLLAGQPASAAAPQTDSVTLSAAAQSGAQVLAAAQGAAGIDKAAVANIRAQLANGSYNVSPENLAQAIATVLKESK